MNARNSTTYTFIVITEQDKHIKLTGRNTIHRMLTNPNSKTGKYLTVCGDTFNIKDSSTTIDDVTCRNCLKAAGINKISYKERGPRVW